MPKTIHLERVTIAARADVWSLLADSPGWVHWTPIDECEVEVAAADDRHEIRRLRSGRLELREEIVVHEIGSRFGYTVLSGLGVRDYLALVDLEDAGDRTRIVWHTVFRSKVPGFGWLYLRALRRATERFIEGLARASVSSG